MNYFDSRGVHRVYEVSLEAGEWRMFRHDPGFSQRFVGKISADAIDGQWQMSEDEKTWKDDLKITFRRAK